MKKLYLGIILSVFLIGIVSAITIGNFITQQQLNNIDIDNLDLDDAFVKINGKVKYDCNNRNICRFYFTQLFINPDNDDGTYEIIEIEEVLLINAEKYIQIKNELGRTEAVQQLRTDLIGKKELVVEGNRKELKGYQTQDAIDFASIVDEVEI